MTASLQIHCHLQEQPATPCTQRLVLFYCQGFHCNPISNNEDHCLKDDRPRCALKTPALAVLRATWHCTGPWGGIPDECLLHWFLEHFYSSKSCEALKGCTSALSTCSAFPIPTPACPSREENKQELWPYSLSVFSSRGRLLSGSENV